MLRAYQKSIERRPLLTNMITAGSLGLAGDLIAQKRVESRESVDWDRCARLTGINTLWRAPLITGWMIVLERLARGRKNILKKLFIDQVLFTPCWLSAFFTVHECELRHYHKKLFCCDHGEVVARNWSETETRRSNDHSIKLGRLGSRPAYKSLLYTTSIPSYCNSICFLFLVNLPLV